MIGKILEASKVNILVVEDDQSNRLVITRLLKLAGIPLENVYECDGDPTNFFSTFNGVIDLIFLDIQLPGKDGYHILKDIRAMPGGEDKVIFALTANVMRHDIDKAKAEGFDGFIGKPIDGRRFSEVLARILAGESVWTIM